MAKVSFMADHNMRWYIVPVSLNKKFQKYMDDDRMDLIYKDFEKYASKHDPDCYEFDEELFK